MKTILRVTFVVALLFVASIAVFYAAGWLTFHQSDERATIEVETGKIKQSAGEAVEGGRKLLKEAADSAADSLEPAEPTKVEPTTEKVAEPVNPS